MLIDPQGRILRSAHAPRTTQELPPEYLRMLHVLADTSAQIRLGLHCADCKQDVVGQNSERDGRWTMACGCRTFVGRNPSHAH